SPSCSPGSAVTCTTGAAKSASNCTYGPPATTCSKPSAPKPATTLPPQGPPWPANHHAPPTQAGPPPGPSTPQPLPPPTPHLGPDEVMRQPQPARHLPRSCKPEPGGVLAVVDRGRCEAKSACVVVCLYDVFEVRALTSGERAAMPVWGRLNLRAHR